MKGKAIWLGVLLVLSSGCDGGTDIAGVIRDPTGQPLGGVLVVLRYEEQEDVEYADSTWTDADGTFHVGFMHEPFNIALSLAATKQRYVTYHRAFKANDAKVDSLLDSGYRITLVTASGR